MRKYEVTLVLDTELDEEGIKTQIQKVAKTASSHDGAIEKEDLWGVKQLAYPMKKKTHGFYVVLVVSAAGDFVSELGRELRISDPVLRFMVVNKDKYAPDLKITVETEAKPDSKPESKTAETSREGASSEAASAA